MTMNTQPYTPSKWLRIDADDMWQIIVPETDIEPHTTASKQEAKQGNAILAGEDCPCHPQIDFGHRLIIHNSFEDEKRIKDSMQNPTQSV